MMMVEIGIRKSRYADLIEYCDDNGLTVTEMGDLGNFIYVNVEGYSSDMEKFLSIVDDWT